MGLIILLSLLVFVLLMGLIDHSVTIAVSNGGLPKTTTLTRSDNAEFTYDDTISASQTDVSIPASIDKDRLNYVYILATYDMTIETNSGSSPANTIALKAGIPFIWFKEYPAASNPFAAADVTGFFATTGANATALTIRILHDATP